MLCHIIDENIRLLVVEVLFPVLVLLLLFVVVQQHDKQHLTLTINWDHKHEKLVLINNFPLDKVFFEFVKHYFQLNITIIFNDTLIIT